MLSAIKDIWTCKNVLKPHELCGALPSPKKAYETAFRIAWPSIVETVLVSLISSVDTMMVGSCGSAAIAGVGVTNQPRFIFLAMIMSFNIGVTAVISRRKGAGDEEGKQRCLKQAVLISSVLSLILTVLAFFLAVPILTLAGANDDTIGYAVPYFRIVMVGALFSKIGDTINAAQRGVGRTKISMTTNLTANAVNLVFNWLLINGIGFFPKLGVIGAAIATALGYFVAFLMSLRSICSRKGELTVFSPVPWTFDPGTIRSMTNVGLSAMAEQVCNRIGFFAYAAMVARLGTEQYAIHLICMNIINMSYAVGDGLSIASSSLVGQNLGANRPDLSKLYCAIAQRIAFCFSTGIFFLFIFGRSFLIGLFTNEQELIRMGGPLMIICACTTHIQTAQVIIAGCLRGAGDTRFVARVSLVSIAVIRPLLTYLFCFPFGFGLIGAWSTLFLDQLTRRICYGIRFRGGRWTMKKL